MMQNKNVPNTAIEDITTQALISEECEREMGSVSREESLSRIAWMRTNDPHAWDAEVRRVRHVLEAIIFLGAASK